MQQRMITLLILSAALVVLLGACSGGGGGSLNDTDWVLMILNEQVPLGSFTLSFADGQVSGKAGCNSYFGDYEQSGETISIPMIGITEMYCMDPEGIMDQESLYVGILSRANTLTTNETQLLLQADDGAFLLFEEVE
ncbi:MAG: META domain-containing protein [Anaerolineales bacterium]|jgi:heat shock protein HslJ